MFRTAKTIELSFSKIFSRSLSESKKLCPQQLQRQYMSATQRDSEIHTGKHDLPPLIKNPRFVTHYKGGEYAIVGHGIHTETEEQLVFYYSTKDLKFYGRPKDMFYSKIEWNGREVDRFTPIDKKKF